LGSGGSSSRGRSNFGGAGGGAGRSSGGGIGGNSGSRFASPGGPSGGGAGALPEAEEGTLVWELVRANLRVGSPRPAVPSPMEDWLGGHSGRLLGQARRPGGSRGPTPCPRGTRSRCGEPAAAVGESVQSRKRLFPTRDGPYPSPVAPRPVPTVARRSHQLRSCPGEQYGSTLAALALRPLRPAGQTPRASRPRQVRPQRSGRPGPVPVFPPGHLRP